MNNMKMTTGVIIGAVVVAGIIIGVLEYQKNQKPNNAGSLYIGITDLTANIAFVDDVDLSIKKVEVYSATGGWVEVASEEKSYKLLALNASGNTELYAKAYVEEGTYNKVRMTLGDVIVKTKSNGDVKASVPSSHVTIDTKVVVKEKMNTSVELDIFADKSLHSTLSGDYIFATVVKVESISDAEVSVGEDNVVVVSGGEVDNSTTAGVDLRGVSKTDFILKTGSSLKVDSTDASKVKFILGGELYEEAEVSDDSSLNIKNSTKEDSFLEVEDSGIDSDEDKNDDSKSKLEVDLKGGIKVN